MNSKVKGDISEVVVMASLVKKGYKLLIPYGENNRYDLVVDCDGRFIRIQCKTGSLKNGSILFYTCSKVSNFSSKKTTNKPYTSKEIDYFGVYCPETDKVYFVDVSLCGSGCFRLRVDKPLNNAEKNINWAVKFENTPF